MRITKLLTMAAILLTIKPAFADQLNEGDSSEISSVQVNQAINLLVKAGVLDIEGNVLVVRQPSILEQLEQLGRVGQGKTIQGGICFNPL